MARYLVRGLLTLISLSVFPAYVLADDCLPPMTPTAEQKAAISKYTDQQRINALADAWIGDLRRRVPEPSQADFVRSLDIRVFANVYGNWTVQVKSPMDYMPLINRSVRFNKGTGATEWQDNNGSGCWNPINPAAEIRLLQ